MKENQRIFLISLVLISLFSFSAFAGGETEDVQDPNKKIIIRFYFPVGVAGPLANAMNEISKDYSKINENVTIEPIYSGGYAETMQRTLTASKAGNPPDIALLTSADVWTGVDEGILTSLEPFIEAEGGESFLANYFPGFLEDGVVSGEYYAFPYQKSTPMFYYNKDMFREAGLDPERAPETWAELMEAAKKLAIKGERWGIEIPVDQWMFSAFIMQNGGSINNEDGTKTYFDTPEAIGAGKYLLSLVEAGVMPAKRLYGDSSADFVAQKTAMMYNSTGSLTFVKNSASFDWGVGYLPKEKKRVVSTGGGQFVIIKGIPEERQKAAWDFIKWMAQPEQAARWSRESGYVAVHKKSFDVPEMKEYIKEFPYAVTARDQLQFAVGEPPKTHSARQISKLTSDAIEGILGGKMSPEEAMANLQAESDRILSPYR